MLFRSLHLKVVARRVRSPVELSRLRVPPLHANTIGVVRHQALPPDDLVRAPLPVGRQREERQRRPRPGRVVGDQRPQLDPDHVLLPIGTAWDTVKSGSANQGESGAQVLLRVGAKARLRARTR